MAEKVICSNCKTSNQKDDKFCLECGRPLGGTATKVLSDLTVDNNSSPQGGKGSDTQPLSKNTSFLPRPVKAVFGDRFYGNNLIHSDDVQHGYLVAEMVVEAGARVLKCTNSTCGAVHAPFDGEVESYCTNCSSDLSDSQLALVLFEARSHIFGNSTELASIGITHPGLRAPVAAFKEMVGGEERFCLVIPYVEPLPSKIERNQVYQWGTTLAHAISYLHKNGVTFNGQISAGTFSVDNGNAVISNFHKSEIVETLNGKTRTADTQAFAKVLFKWLTGRSEYAKDPGLAPVVNEFFETALLSPGFANADVFAQSFDEVLRKTVAVKPVDHHLGRGTDVGVVRTLNEDSLLTIQFDKFLESVPASLGVYVVADGMGGHSAGEIASGTIVNTIAEMANSELMAVGSSVDDKDHCAWIKKTMQAANKAVYDMARKMGSDMGSTIVMAIVDGSTVCIGHVGDSRAYKINSSGITPLTTDHSLVERLIDTGQITREEARTHPQRNVIYRTMGDKAKVDVDTGSHKFSQGDRLLLCSDGLNGMVEDEVLRQIVMEKSRSPQEACDMLVQAAKAAGGDDNITVVVLEMG